MMHFCLMFFENLSKKSPKHFRHERQLLIDTPYEADRPRHLRRLDLQLHGLQRRNLLQRQVGQQTDAHPRCHKSADRIRLLAFKGDPLGTNPACLQASMTSVRREYPSWNKTKGSSFSCSKRIDDSPANGWFSGSTAYNGSANSTSPVTCS